MESRTKSECSPAIPLVPTLDCVLVPRDGSARTMFIYRSYLTNGAAFHVRDIFPCVLSCPACALFPGRKVSELIWGSNPKIGRLGVSRWGGCGHGFHCVPIKMYGRLAIQLSQQLCCLVLQCLALGSLRFASLL